MTSLARAALALLPVAGVAACAVQPAVAPSVVVTSPRTQVVSAANAQDAVAIGRSTRADVRAALGETLVLGFDNGYEVWVYRLAAGAGADGRRESPARAAAARGEFVILFAPSGVAAKTRIRIDPRAGDAR